MASQNEPEFVDKLTDDNICCICTNLLNSPMLTDCCGQHFCEECLQNWLQRHGQRTCPHCRAQGFNYIKSLPMERAIDSLKIYCPNSSKGCDKIPTLGECNQHLEKCLFVEISCTKKCGERMFRKELLDHEDNKCPNRLIQCQYCTLEGMHKEITAKNHIDECIFFLISCPNNCGHKKVQRKNLAIHQDECPLEPVECLFSGVGCTEMIPRKDMAAHKASNTEHHLELVMTETVTLKHKANRFEQKANKLEQEANHEKHQLQQLSLKFGGLASCVTNQLSTIDSNPRNTQAAIKNIKSSLETMTTMLAPGDTRYYLSLVEVSQHRARSASFYIKPGYKMYVSIDSHDNCTIYLEKGEHDHILKWPMPEMEMELSITENSIIILYDETICTRCGYTVNRLEGDRTQQPINYPRARCWHTRLGVLRDFVFLTVRNHKCVICNE